MGPTRKELRRTDVVLYVPLRIIYGKIMPYAKRLRDLYRHSLTQQQQLAMYIDSSFTKMSQFWWKFHRSATLNFQERWRFLHNEVGFDMMMLTLQHLNLAFSVNFGTILAGQMAPPKTKLFQIFPNFSKFSTIFTNFFQIFADIISPYILDLIDTQGYLKIKIGRWLDHTTQC